MNCFRQILLLTIVINYIKSIIKKWHFNFSLSTRDFEEIEHFNNNVIVWLTLGKSYFLYKTHVFITLGKQQTYYYNITHTSLNYGFYKSKTSTTGERATSYPHAVKNSPFATTTRHRPPSVTSNICTTDVLCKSSQKL